MSGVDATCTLHAGAALTDWISGTAAAAAVVVVVAVWVKSRSEEGEKREERSNRRGFRD